MKLTIALIKGEDCWIARCLDFMITKTAKTKEDAIIHLLEALSVLNQEFKLVKIAVNKKKYSDWELVTREWNANH